MGGTLAARGGHNILEPALAARPIVTGPHMENFAEIAADFRANGALVEVADATALAGAVVEMLENPARAAELGAKAAACARARQGATAMAADEARAIFGRHVPCYRPAQPGFALLWILSRIWIWGATAESRTQHRARRRRLHAPVISVGNITAGGTGKTPMVLHLTRRLKDAGWHPGILTRGYGRHSPQAEQAVAAGAHLPVSQSGDEPQLFLRAGIAPVGIGADRWRVGQVLEHEFGVDAIVLDDGFQHARLERSLDIVLVDALDPFGGGYPLPLGRLREPLAALSRADIFVVTRSDSGRVAQAAEHFLRRRMRARRSSMRARSRKPGYPRPPAKRSPRMRCPTRGWRLSADWAIRSTSGTPSRHWGSSRSVRIEFEDHHAYKPRELRYMGRQFREEAIEAVVTTEKDLVNLCEDPCLLLAPLPLYWLRIGVHVDREEEMLEEIVLGLRRYGAAS